MLRFLVVTIAAILAVTQSAPTAADSCTLNGYTASHGELFTPPGVSKCIKYKCYKGTSHLTREGCDFDAQIECLSVNKIIRKNCITYACSKSSQGGISTYSISIVKALCADKEGDCRNPGDTFEYIIGGKWYSKCTCTVTNDNKVSYSCGG